MSERKLTKCPICGSPLVYSTLYQVSHDYKITRSGKLSKRYKRSEDMPLDCGAIFCTNNLCDFQTNFELKVEGYPEYKIRSDGEDFILVIEE